MEDAGITGAGTTDAEGIDMAWKWTGFSFDPEDWYNGAKEIANDLDEWSRDPFGEGNRVIKNKDDWWKLYGDDIDYWTQLADMDMPFIDPFIENYIRRKQREDQKRWWDDYERNTGQSYRNSKYPWLHTEDYRASDTSSFRETFEASNAVIGLYRKWWL